MASRSALAAARDIGETFARMAMNDEETCHADRRHTFSKTRVPLSRGPHRPKARAAPLQGWVRLAEQLRHRSETTRSPVAWRSVDPDPDRMGQQLLETLFAYDWGPDQEPGRRLAVGPPDPAASTVPPDPHDPSKTHAPVMLTTDLALDGPDLRAHLPGGSWRTPTSSPQRSRRRGSSSHTATWVPFPAISAPEVPAEQLIWSGPGPTP